VLRERHAPVSGPAQRRADPSAERPAIRAVISDFGGVLTNRLVEAFLAFQDESGISMDQLGRGMQRIAERNGEYPLYRLERGEMSEADFLDDLSGALQEELGHRPKLHEFSEIWLKGLKPNQPMIDLMRELGRRGFRLAILTNNVREWEARWRAKLPIDEIFELVVDSAWVGMRKPEPEIYNLTLERLGALDPEQCLFVDDNELNVEAARKLGIKSVHFQSTEQAIAEIREALGLD
jgi:putative hydrolase of the HAD superfamily